MNQPSDAAILATENLGRQVGDKVLVTGVTVKVHSGEALAVVGPSGSGKSSFLRLLNRLDEPSTGTVFLEGVDYRQIPPRELRRKVGMVTQRPFLFPGTVAQNLRFGPAQTGQVLPDDAAEQLLSRVGLFGYAARDVANLSGGEAQRVSLARALANTPIVLLLDEPTSSLDEGAKLEVEGLIKEIIRSRRLTCIVVTHDLAQAGRLADRVMTLESGRVLRIGSVEEVLRA
ncbi:MAG TPA: phosphate ABC transporter ATP-binding protein [Terriglobales bacterium]